MTGGQREVPAPLEFCRECRDEDAVVPAVVIIWGKLFPLEALGPRCLDHAAKHIGWASMSRLDQVAVFDLRLVERRRGQP